MSQLGEREVSAVTFNLKQERLLENTRKKLALEQTYSLKLLEVNHRLVKVNYSRLKERVARIKSYLSLEDIVYLKQLEHDGKFTPEFSGIIPSGAVQIAAAAKRLNLHQNSLDKRPKTVPVVRQTFHDKRPQKTERNVYSSIDRNLNSDIIEHDTPKGDFNLGILSKQNFPVPANSAESRKTNINDNNVNKNGIPPTPIENISETTIQTTNSNAINNKNTAANDVNVTPISDKQTVGNIKPTSTERKSGRNVKCGGRYVRTALEPDASNFYSSHDTLNVESRRGYWGLNKSSAFETTTDRVDQSMGLSANASQRSQLMKKLSSAVGTINSRRRNFMTNISTYIKNNPVHTGSFVDGQRQLQPERDNDKNLPDKHRESMFKKKIPLRRIPSQLDINQRFTRADYDAKMREYWRDLNRCRYLRVPDDQIEYSAVSTLAINQLKLSPPKMAL